MLFLPNTNTKKKYLRDLKFNWKLNYYMYEIIGEKVCLLTHNEYEQLPIITHNSFDWIE